ncbi:replication-relaxation family protein [Nocardia brasiliensis]
MRRDATEIGLEVRVEIQPTGTADASSRLAHHFTSTHFIPSSPFNSHSSVVPATTDGAHTGTTHSERRPRRPISVRRDIWAIGDSLSVRDWTVVRSVAEHRFLTVGQIHALHFSDLSRTSGLRIAQRALARLRELRLLGTMERRVGGIRAGSEGLVHYVDTNGERLLKAETGKPIRRHMTDPTETFLKHTLAVADAHVALKVAHQAGRLELLAYQVEPAAWRPYVGMAGARLILKPDSYAETVASSDSEFEDAWFIEIDLGTESIPRLIKKCRDYEGYRRMGIEQERSDGAFPRVIWSLTAKDLAKAERRRVALREAIDRDRELPSELFHVIAPDELINLVAKGGGE